MITNCSIKTLKFSFKFIYKSCVMNFIRRTSESERKQYQSVKNLKDIISKQMGIETGYSSVAKDRSHLLKNLPKSQDELPKRSMGDSFAAGLIPLSTDTKLQDKYVTAFGGVRLGRLLEDMDMFAVLVSYKHIVNPKQPENEPFSYTLVTALVDRIDFTDFIPKPKEDIKISGHVCWVGKSSMEVVVWLEQLNEGVWNRITRALFVMAARNSTNSGSVVINPIDPANERERTILSGGEDRKNRRIETTKQHTSRTIPDATEQKLIYDMYLRTTKTMDISSIRNRDLPAGCVWMSKAVMDNVMFTHPEDRNIQNTVFGGFIMRQATELSAILGYKYSRQRPILKSISDINFQKPISIGSLLQMHAYVVFTEENYLQFIVIATAYDTKTFITQQTNTFHITYRTAEKVPEVIPSTYHQTMMFVDGRRHFLGALKKESMHQEK